MYIFLSLLSKHIAMHFTPATPETVTRIDRTRRKTKLERNADSLVKYATRNKRAPTERKNGRDKEEPLACTLNGILKERSQNSTTRRGGLGDT